MGILNMVRTIRSFPIFPESASVSIKDSRHNESKTANCRGKKIGILIVAFNAASTLVQVLRRITPEVWRNVEEVVVFDDASTDATQEIVVGVKTLQNITKLKVFKNSKNLGYGGNQKKGYRYMMSKGMDIVVLLHGDGQYAPEILSHLYAPIIKNEADAVFGSRMTLQYGGPLKGGMPFYKYIGNRILTTIENYSLKLDLSEFHSGYRAYSIHALKKINMDYMTDDFHFDTEIIIKFKHQEFRIIEIPIPTYYGDEICYVNGIKYAWNVVKALRHYKQTISSAWKYPEFKEYWVNYPLKNAQYSSHDIVIQKLHGPLKILDIGCGQGFLAERLSEKGCEVTGVDSIEKPQRLSSMQSYLSCDLNHGFKDIKKNLRSGYYDVILLLDILEHLTNPGYILKEIRNLLNPSGYLIASFPNVANISVRLKLLFGRWDYADRGILDRTHVHFYTRKTSLSLIKNYEYKVINQLMTVIPVEVVFGLKSDVFLMKFISKILWPITNIMPGLLGYQTIIFARPQ
jgi:glycosyltransferase involved in cell wall biosynthesis